MTASSSLSDEELMARVQAGDSGAFSVLFHRHEKLLQQRVMGRMRANLRRKVSVTDVLQETRIIALERCGEFEDRGPGSVRKWLDRIAERKVQEVVRHHIQRAKRAVGREVTRGRRPDTAQFVAAGPSPSQAAIAAERAQRVQRALRSLSRDHETVLRLAREEGLSLREVGERMGRSREAAKKLYARALAHFTEVFQKLGERK
ncbi:MAG: sigma-70 family RNA polymerase sigma factor [Planctomycetota bacterium]|jgi:RNA polymerase sigma-70 factor (ECF subfamily)